MKREAFVVENGAEKCSIFLASIGVLGEKMRQKECASAWKHISADRWKHISVALASVFAVKTAPRENEPWLTEEVSPDNSIVNTKKAS